MERGETSEDSLATGAPLSPLSRALYCVGAGLSLLVFCGSSPVGAYLAGLTGSWQVMLVAQALLFAATAIGTMTVSHTTRGRAVPDPILTNLLSPLAIVTCLAIGHVCARPVAPAWVVLVLTFLAGLAASCPLMYWPHTLGVIYREQGRMHCIALIAGSALVAMATPLLLAPFLRTQQSLLAACIVIAIVAAACQITLVRRLNVPRDVPLRTAARTRRYRLSPYSVVMMSSIGTTTGMSVAMILHALATGAREPASWAPMFIPAAVSAAVAIAAHATHTRAPQAEGPRFGLAVRLLVSVTTLAFAVVPLLPERAPHALIALLGALLCLQFVVAILFSVEIAHEISRHTFVVSLVNFAPFALAASVGCLAVLACQTLVSGRAVGEVVAAVAILATVVVIPLLPSVSSDAVTFTLPTLPENEGYEQRLDRAYGRLAREHDLSAREGEVLGLLLRGLSRQEIARELSLSRWTVKDHMGSIYAKVGVHSYQELVAQAQRAFRARG